MRCRVYVTVGCQQQRRAAGLLLSSGAGSRHRSIAEGARAVAAGSYAMLRAEILCSTDLF